ncbi:hypothetical protein AXG93_488s1070 [Marchantia polymorpha subsp. ruderalis]|uniref:Uncharacterized protein n=1 Tax=Marchantia polymorpha subsp. ruderalis TaxID=1480154 RepID=A0A176W6Q0_MARPO|nr:hypothetical protein AXG93_488s1070 [Marchantia polymorpha subsp. ruderalis]
MPMGDGIVQNTKCQMLYSFVENGKIMRVKRQGCGSRVASLDSLEGRRASQSAPIVPRPKEKWFMSPWAEWSKKQSRTGQDRTGKGEEPVSLGALLLLLFAEAAAVGGGQGPRNRGRDCVRTDGILKPTCNIQLFRLVTQERCAGLGRAARIGRLCGIGKALWLPFVRKREEEEEVEQSTAWKNMALQETSFRETWHCSGAVFRESRLAGENIDLRLDSAA